MTAMFALCSSVIIGGVGQVVLRRGVSTGDGQKSAKSASWWLHLLRSPWLWCYAICFALATALWMLALSQIDISYAFPLLSANYILVALLSRVILKEPVGWRRWLSIAVISLGVLIIAKH